MAQTKINGHEQIKAASITSAEVDGSIFLTNGSVALTGALDAGGHRLTNGSNASGANDFVTLAQLQSYLQGLSPLIAVQAMTTGAETYTISGGAVTQISGTTVDGQSFSIGDRILIKNAPSASGAGVADSGNAGSAQPANGVYTITGNTTNLTVSRDSTSATPLYGSINPAGKYVYTEAGSVNSAGVGYIVASPATPDTAFTYGTTNMQWGKLQGAGGGSVTTVSVNSGNGFAGSVTNASTTPAINITTTITGVLKGNGTALQAATASTDYMAPASFVIRETPSGSVNGSNTAFTLANTPLAGTEEVYINGILQDPGSGNDYTISGATITTQFAPASGDKIRVSYQK